MARQTDLQIHSVDAFLNGLIDYAGLFPPAKLPLDEAIKNYASYIKGEDQWMIGPFVMPAAYIGQLEKYISLFNNKQPLHLSALGRKGNDETTAMQYMEEDLHSIEKFRKQYGKIIQVDFFEVALPSLYPSKEFLEELQRVMAKHQLRCYAELPIQSDAPIWDVHLQEVLGLISSINEYHPDPIGVKLRSGGITADLIPSIEVVASFIYGCRTYKVPCKFTAGLHHPIRMFRKEVGTEMHGFVNMFAAGLLAYVHDLDRAQIMEILADQEPSNFSFQPEKFMWKDMEVSSAGVRQLRQQYLCSYGSCSFDEPRDELRALDIIERG